MSEASRLAFLHQERLIQINRVATSRVLRLWRQVDINALDDSWAQIEPAMVQQAESAQLAAARLSDSYTASLSRAYGRVDEVSRIVPGAFVGVDGSGRPMGSLLHGAVTTTKQSVGAGLGRAVSFEAGAVFLAVMMKTGLADLGRQADMTAAVGKGYTQYVRVVNPGACSRCAILAGISSYEDAFERHPACKCTSAPIHVEGKPAAPEGLFSTPDDYFESLSEAEQDRIFTRGGAEAIRSGANVQDVVSARRGASGISTSRGIGRGTVPNSGRRMQREVIGRRPDGTPIMGYTTTEGTYRGSFRRAQDRLGVSTSRGASRYSNTNRVRLMPETIVSLTDDPAARRVLLRDAGYIDLDYRLSPLERAAQAQADRDWANRIYRMHGFQLG